MAHWARSGAIVGALVLGLGAERAAAQARKGAAPPASVVPSITAVVPSGARIGRTTEWVVTGSNLGPVDLWSISGNGAAVEHAEVTPAGDRATLTVLVDEQAAAGVRELRATGPDGISNLARVRLDHLPSRREVEPNDARVEAMPVRGDVAVEGTLKARDRDWFRVEGHAGQRLTVEIEARRLGTPVQPLIAAYHSSGGTLAQWRDSPGLEGDCRGELVLPDDGACWLEVRDALFAGADLASYRLRVEEAGRFATSGFPLAGQAGEELLIQFGGGTIDGPCERRVCLPSEAGRVVEIGPIGGGYDAPTRALAWDGPLREEDRDGPSKIVVGEALNGRLSVPGEVDRARLELTPGQSIQVEVRAAALGSWLDSVLVLRDASGAILVENDDPPANAPNRPSALGALAGGAAALTDSRVEYTAREGQSVTIEIADRYGRGGPEFGYVLAVVPERADFSVTLLLGPVNGQPVAQARAQRGRFPGQDAALSVKPGTKVPVNFQIASTGDTGPIEVRAEGLPPGVTAAPVEVRPRPVARGSLAARGNQFKSAALTLQVAADAQPALGELRLVAESKPKDGQGPPLRRTASVTLPIDSIALFGPMAPVSQTFTTIPVAITRARPRE